MSLLEAHLNRHIHSDEASILGNDPTFVEIVEAIRSIPENWKGNCFAVATMIAESGLLQNATAVYGHWLGRMGKCFTERKGVNPGFVQHGWVLLEDGRILDATRWVFEDVEPYIFIGRPPDEENPICKHCGHAEDVHGVVTPCSGGDDEDECDCEEFSPLLWPYDEGGNKLREAAVASRPLPTTPKISERKPIFSKASSATLKFLSVLFNDSDLPKKGASSAQAFYVANLPYKTLGDHVHEIYDALKANDLDAFIPIDNMMKSQRERSAR